MNTVAVKKARNRLVIALDAPTGAEPSKDLVANWAKENRANVRSFEVIRVVGKAHIISVDATLPEGSETVYAQAMRMVDRRRDQQLTDFGIATLKDRYLLDGESSPQEGFMRAALAFADDIDHANRLYEAVSRGWFMFATPVLSNAPRRERWGKTWEENFKSDCFEVARRGLPISCFLNYVPDSRVGLTDHYTETAWLSSAGGGVGGYWGAIRSDGVRTSGGSRSSGMIPFLKVVDSQVMAFAQGGTRRASYAAYADISHPEIIEFLEMRKPTGGDVNRKCLNLHNAVSIPDSFMKIIEECMRDPGVDDSWPLIDPHTHKVVRLVSAKELWQRLMELRVETGEPYILFIDTANRALPESQKALGLRVHQSNLCAEIMLPTNEERTAVCCLSSVNLEKFDEWSREPRFIEDLVRMLDNVLEYFIQNTPEAMARAKFSASRERSIGLGAMGFHSLLQLRGLPFVGAMATSVNRQVFAFIKKGAMAATRKLAHERGACPDAGEEMRRNMHLIAVAPNASSSILCGGTSPSIEPIAGNAFTHKTQSGSWLVKNRALAKVLEKYGRNDEETWSSIVTNEGSVQHLEFLTDEEREVYKTARELDQRWIIEHAKHRQEFICQSQSVNLFLPPDVQISYLHHVHFQAWKAGLKSLYYVRSKAIRRADNVSVKVSKQQLVADETCLSCEG